MKSPVLIFRPAACAGFTLLELVAALSITALLLGGSFVSLRRLLSDVQLRRASKELLQVINHNAILARESRQDVLLRFDYAGDVAQLLPSPGLSGTIPSSSRAFRLPQGLLFNSIRFADTHSGPDVLVLRSNGTASPGTVTIENRYGRQCRIVQALRGARRYLCP